MKRYSRYKDSGMEGVGEVPSDWSIKKLKFIANIQNSNVDKKSYEHETKVRLCNYVDVYKNMFITPKLELMEATASEEEIERFRVKVGDVLITKDSEEWNDIAIPAYVAEAENDMVCGYHLSQIRTNEGVLDGKYLFMAFLAKDLHHQFDVSANGVTRYGVPKSAIDNSLFTVPSYKEQKNIAFFLDQKTSQIDSLISKKKQMIDLLKEERAAIINHAVTKGINPDAEMKDSGVEWLGEVPKHWEVKKLKNAAEINSETLPENINEELKIEYIDIGNVNFGKPITNIQQFKFIDAPSRARRILRKGDTIISTVRTYLKAISYIEFEKENLIGSTGFAVIRPSKKSHSLFYFYLLTCDKIIDTICANSVGVSYPAVSSNIIGNIPVWLPDPIEQKEIASYLEQKTAQIDSSIAHIEKEISLIEEYRTALINETVTGKIDIRDKVNV